MAYIFLNTNFLPKKVTQIVYEMTIVSLSAKKVVWPKIFRIGH